MQRKSINDEAKARISESVKALWADPEYRARMVAERQTRKDNLPLRQKQSASHKKLWEDQEYRATVIDRLQQGLHSPEGKLKAGEGQKRRFSKPDEREKRSKSAIRASPYRAEHPELPDGAPIARYSLEYKVWRSAVLERDDFTCQVCGATTKLVAHHITEWKNSITLRYDVSNGLTMCRACHIKHHKPHLGAK